MKTKKWKTPERVEIESLGSGGHVSYPIEKLTQIRRICGALNFKARSEGSIGPLDVLFSYKSMNNQITVSRNDISA